MITYSELMAELPFTYVYEYRLWQGMAVIFTVRTDPSIYKSL